MAEERAIYRFGPFELHADSCMLTRGGRSVDVSRRSVEVLRLLVKNAGKIVQKDTIISEVWQNAVEEGSLSRAIWDLRKAVGTQADGADYIETRRGQGFICVAGVERIVPRECEASLQARLDRHRAFVDGRAAVESFDCRVLMSARETFADVLAGAPDDVAAHIGMANACLLTFESTRVDLAPDVAALQLAVYHARQAWQLEPTSARSWSTLALVLHRTGKRGEALLAAREAVTREPGSWLHHLRHASVSWADERLLAAQQVLRLCPELAPAHWFAATVHVARQAFDRALEQVVAGCVAQDAQSADRRRFHVVGFHLLHGLLLLARGRLDEALQEFDRELDSCEDHHVYGRERAANVWCARGALQLRRERPAEAVAAFEQSLVIVPGHPAAATVLAALSDSPLPLPRAGMDPVDAATLAAIPLAISGRHDEAARTCADALSNAQPDSAGWLLPIDPLLDVTGHREAWSRTLSILSAGAH